MNYYMDVLKKYIKFDGRSRRAEYWTFYLVNIIVGAIIGFFIPMLATIYALAIFLPSLGVAVRRLHDIGKSGVWLLLAITGIGVLVLLYFYVKPGDIGDNKYGPNPKINHN